MHPDWRTDLMRYCEEFSSPETPLLQDLVRYTWLHTVNPRQLSGHLQGRFLAMLSKLMRPECILEIGTFTGYSALCLAEGLAENGILHSVEADPEMAHKAADFINKSAPGHKIHVHMGNALEIIPSLGLKPNMIFVDAGKQEYRSYYEICLPMLVPGGLMLFDNTLWSMKVLDKEERNSDFDTISMHEFNNYLAAQEGIELVLLPLRDGLTLLRKK